MADKVWKSFERKIAKLFDSRRTPSSGAFYHEGDVRHDRYYIECKYRKKIPFIKTFKETQIIAEEQHKIPIVVFREKGTQLQLALLEVEELASLEKDRKELDCMKNPTIIV
jgi:hypothetical protein